MSASARKHRRAAPKTSPRSALAVTIVPFASALVLLPTPAHALPAFARQTGQPCAMCHVGGFGPQLTAYGREFKLNGYTWGDVKSRLENFSAMIFGGMEHTSKDLTANQQTTHYGANNNWAVDQVSLFYGGKIAGNLGAFAQATYSGTGDSYSWDNTDIRYVRDAMLGGKPLVYGVDVNNNPSLGDLWQSTPAWGFPYVSSGLAPGPDYAPYLAGSMAQTVGGLGFYGMWNDAIYAELTGYMALPDNIQRPLGETVSGADHLSGVNPYWRLAYQKTLGPNYFSVGTFGMDTKRYPSDTRQDGTDTLLDTALDATYQYTTPDMNHAFSLYASALHEHQDLGATHALGSSTNTTDTLNQYSENASYYYKNTYGLTVKRFDITGSADAGAYANTGKPDSAGWTFQADYTPWGKEGAPFGPNVNARFFLQYTMYNKFDGASSNYDGAGRSAADNNTLYFGTWLAF
ncbi:MAG: cytochrome C [Alphaproteobacteria bacterium]|nr:cytochrome C [Alphaproteobacteria bacterium]